MHSPISTDNRHTADTPIQGDSEPKFTRLPGLGAYLALALWFAAVLAAISTGVYEDGGNPPVALITTVASPILGMTAAYLGIPRFRHYVLSLDLRLILGAQLWRVVGMAFLFALAFDQLPAGFALPAGIGDVATGIAALAVVISLGNATLTRGRLYAFTALGIGDFMAAIFTGLTLRPPELDVWPLIIFPTMMVPFFAILHLISVLQSRHHWRDRVQHMAGSTG